MPESYVIAIVHENAIDEEGVVFSGGSWVNTATMKLSNLATDPMSEIVRSTSADPADTQFDVDLGRARTIGGVALGNTNIQATAQWRFRAWQDAGHLNLLYDTGLLGIPGGIVPSMSLPWSDPHWWLGISQEFDDPVKGASLIHLPPTNVYARYVRFEIIDPTNPANYIEIGRAAAGKKLSPRNNFIPGSTLSFDDLPDVEVSRNGTRFFNDRNIMRVFNCAFEYLPDAEAIQQIYRLAMRTRRSKQIVLVPFPDKPETYQRDAFFGRLEQLPSIQRNVHKRINTAMIIKESL